MRNIISLIVFTTVSWGCISCHHDTDDVVHPKNPNDNELITTLKVIFKNTSNNSITEFIYQDLNGNGVPTIFDTIRLLENTSYSTQILLLDETKNPIDTISNAVREEGTQHQFFFTPSNVNLTINYIDTDANGVPLGLETTWLTGAKTTEKTSKVIIRLKHQGTSKPTSGNGDANIGNTDVEVNFPVIISPN